MDTRLHFITCDLYVLHIKESTEVVINRKLCLFNAFINLFFFFTTYNDSYRYILFILVDLNSCQNIEAK